MINAELIDGYLQSCVMLEKKRVPDGLGGFETSWADGDEFDAAITHLDCVMAEAMQLIERDPTEAVVAQRIRDIVNDRLKPGIAAASAIVNGAPLLTSPMHEAGESEAQAAVDELFP